MEKMLASLATTAIAAVSKMSNGDGKPASSPMANNESNQLFKSVLNKQVSAQQTETIKANAKHALNAAPQKPAVQKVDANQAQDEPPAKSVDQASDNSDQSTMQSTSKPDADSADVDGIEHEANHATDEMLALAVFSQPLTTVAKPDISAATNALSAQLRGLSAGKAEKASSVLPSDTAAKTADNLASGIADTANRALSQADRTNNSMSLAKPDVLTADAKSTFAKQLDAAQLQQEVGAEVNTKNTGEALDTHLATMMASAEKSSSLVTPQSINASQAIASRPVIDAYPGKAGWDQAISQRVIYMAGAGEQSATLTLNPPDLGPLQVVVSLNNGQADASFTSDNAEVRQALQDGMDNLREKMRESGVQLGQTNVQSGEQSRQVFEQATQHRSTESRMTSAASSAIDNLDGVSKKVAVKVLNGLVDTFA